MLAKWKYERYRVGILVSFLCEVVEAIPEDCDPMGDLARVREKAQDYIEEFGSDDYADTPSE